MNSQLTHKLSQKEKKDFNVQRQHSVLANTLREWYQKELDLLTAEDEKTSQYDCPNWAALQAHKNGRQAEVRKILKLLEKDKL